MLGHADDRHPNVAIKCCDLPLPKDMMNTADASLSGGDRFGCFSRIAKSACYEFKNKICPASESPVQNVMTAETIADGAVGRPPDAGSDRLGRWRRRHQLVRPAELERGSTADRYRRCSDRFARRLFG